MIGTYEFESIKEEEPPPTGGGQHNRGLSATEGRIPPLAEGTSNLPLANAKTNGNKIKSFEQVILEARSLNESQTTSENTTITVGVLYVFNSHGDVIELVSTTGQLLNSYKYDAFGNILEKGEVVTSTFKYSGYVYDEDSGLYYLRSRYYNPQTARFISEDSFNGYYTDPLSLNKYTYCHNNPVSYNDPDGEAVNIIVGLFGAGLGALISGGIELVGQLVQGGEINWNAVGAMRRKAR